MKNLWHLGKLAGIEIKVHWTILLPSVWVLFSTLYSGGTVVAAAAYVGLVFAVFACVALHELGHALIARKFGVGTRCIVLLPIGGVASLERIPNNPFQELMIALAGPAVNVGIATLLFIGMAISPLTGIAAWFLYQIAWINFGLVLFNLLPAFPMDGGRVLRSVLAMVMSHHRATQIATSVGKVAAIVMGLLGIFSGNLMVLLIAGFVFIAATAESLRNQGEQFHASHNGSDMICDSPVNSSSLCYADLPKISAEWDAASALQWLSRRTGERFPVVKNGSVIGFATLGELQLAVATGKGMWPVEKLQSIQLVT